MTRSDAQTGDASGDVRLMALADGELPPPEAAVVARVIAADPDAARRFAVFAETRARLAAAAAVQDDVPAALRARVAATVAGHAAARATDAAVQDGTVLRPAFGGRTAPAWALALAASLALAVGLGAGFMARAPGPGAPVAGFASAAVQDALGRLATGETAETPTGAVRVLSSFRDGAGALCRAAELRAAEGDGARGVLCRADDGVWHADLVLRQPDPSAAGAISTASGAGAVDAFLADIGAGVPLDPEAETAALAE